MAQVVERVAHSPEDRQFDSRLPLSACQSALEQDTESKLLQRVTVCINGRVNSRKNILKRFG